MSAPEESESQGDRGAAAVGLQGPDRLSASQEGGEREREKKRMEAMEEEEEEMGMEGGRRYWQEQRQGGKER